MTKFIKVTERYNDKLKALIINTDYVSAIKLGDKNRDTMIQIANALDSGKCYFVVETPEQIWEMLNSDYCDYSKPMTIEEYEKYFNEARQTR